MKHNKGEEINGWLVVDKPRGMGSTDVVRRTKRLFRARKNGHAGTLDPFATGVLPVAFGEATKLLPFVTDGVKEYEFVIRWGISTDTDDSEGEVIAQCEKIPERSEIEAVIPAFLGKIVQVLLKLTGSGLMIWREKESALIFPNGRWKSMLWNCLMNYRISRRSLKSAVPKGHISVLWARILP